MEVEIRGMTGSIAALGFGARGMLLALFVLHAGPLNPYTDIGTSIGEIAGNMRTAALRAVPGIPHPMQALVGPAWDIDRIRMAATPVFGILVVFLGIAVFIRRGPKRTATCGMTVSLAAIFVQVFLIAALLIAGAILFVGVMQNMDSIRGG